MTATPPTPLAAHGFGDHARLAAALRDARGRAGLTGVEAGKRAGMSHSKLSKIERGVPAALR